MCGSGGGAAVPGGQIRAADRKANEGHGRGARAPGSQEKPAGHTSTAVSFGQNWRAGQIAGDGAPSRQTKAGNHEDRSGLSASEADLLRGMILDGTRLGAHDRCLWFPLAG